MNCKTWTDEQLIEAVKNNRSYSSACAELNLGRNTRSIKKRIAELNIDTSHFMNKTERLEYLVNLNKERSKRSDDEIFTINNMDRRQIKEKIIKEGLIEYKCSICSIVEYTGKKLSLQLDHINGINNDNRLENLRFLCPNCHSQTDNYCGRALKNKSPIKKDGINITYAEKQNTKTFCIDCNIEISHSSERCRECDGKRKLNTNTKIDWPDTEYLIKDVKEFGFCEIGRRLGVTDNTVRKRISRHPNYKKENNE